MKKSKKIILSAAAFFISVYLFAWGIWGHEHINHAAVFALPVEMRTFYYNHIDFITEESSVPDLRKYLIVDKTESARHYIDVESYNTESNFDSIPITWKEVTAKYDSAFLQKNGILPWYIPDMETKLTAAFKAKQKTAILFLSGDIAHYLGDAEMPLHTALNHDGQFTNQKGIHAFWESQLPELFGDQYNFHVADAKYVSDIQSETWNIIKQTHKLENTMLLADKQLSETFPADKIYAKDSAGNFVLNVFKQKVHTYKYAAAYNKALNGMVENQMQLGIQHVADFWFTAWVNAGKPDLSTLDPHELTDRNKKYLRKDYKDWLKGKLHGFKATNEY